METLTITEASRFLKNATNVASYYGFVPVHDQYKETTVNSGQKSPFSEKRPGESVIASLTKGDNVSEALAYVASHATVSFGEEDGGVQPRLLYHVNVTPERGEKTKELLFALSAFGILRSIAEAIIIKTALAILYENDANCTHVYINSMGDSDSGAKFSREACTYLKKNAGIIPTFAREALKSDVYRALIHLGAKNHPVYEDVPKTMEFLSDKSRRHFSEFLEYLESTDTPYAIDNRIIGHGSSYRETMFEIRNKDDEERVVCRGGRCDELAKTLFDKKEASLVGATIQIHFQGVKVPPVTPQRTRKPKAYLIQVGLPARRKTLGIIETLRCARIPLAFSLYTEGLRDQLLHASELAIPYVVIIGQREALNDTAIVRNLDSQAQEIIPITSLPKYLKKL